jgi:hypothetical protein
LREPLSLEWGDSTPAGREPYRIDPAQLAFAPHDPYIAPPDLPIAVLRVLTQSINQMLLENMIRLSDRDRYHPLRAKPMLRRIGRPGLAPVLFDRPKSNFVMPCWCYRKGATL